MDGNVDALLRGGPLVRPAPRRPALFIAAEGTLVEPASFTDAGAALRWVPGAMPALSAIAGAGFLLVALGAACIDDGRDRSRRPLERIKGVLTRRLRDEAGIALADFLYCPHAPDADGRWHCGCHRPEPGLLLDAAERHCIDLQRSRLVGSTLDDIEAGHRAGCRAVLYSRRPLRRSASRLRQPDEVVRDWDEVAAPRTDRGPAPACPEFV